MNKASLLSINLYINKAGVNFLLNENPKPLLFYWNEKDDFVEIIKNNKDFRKLIDRTSFNKDIYANAKIAYFKFALDNNEEKYEEGNYNIQDIFLLRELDEIESDFYKEYILEIFESLYSSSMKSTYVGDILFDIEQKIKDIYIQIQNKFLQRFIKSSVINYVRSELEKTSNLNKDNINWIIDNLLNILKNEK